MPWRLIFRIVYLILLIKLCYKYGPALLETGSSQQPQKDQSATPCVHDEFDIVDTTTSSCRQEIQDPRTKRLKRISNGLGSILQTTVNVLTQPWGPSIILSILEDTVYVLQPVVYAYNNLCMTLTYLVRLGLVKHPKVGFVVLLYTGTLLLYLVRGGPSRLPALRQRSHALATRLAGSVAPYLPAVAWWLHVFAARLAGSVPAAAPAAAVPAAGPVAAADVHKSRFGG